MEPKERLESNGAEETGLRPAPDCWGGTEDPGAILLGEKKTHMEEWEYQHHGNEWRIWAKVCRLLVMWRSSSGRHIGEELPNMGVFTCLLMGNQSCHKEGKPFLFDLNSPLHNQMALKR